jgi:CDP-diacylglycerol--glycerol-3-phosphate 3-phosphatidyltransferase
MKVNSLTAYQKSKKGYIAVQLVTMARIPLAVIFAVFLILKADSILKLILSCLILLLIEASDAFDGVIARRFNLASEYGATLDPYSDSISRLVIYWSLASNHLVLWLVPLCMAVRDVTVAYSRIMLARRNLSVSAKKSGKIKAIFQAVGAFFALLGPYYWLHIGNWSFYTLSWIIIIVTLLSSVEYVRAAILTLKQN